MIVMLIGMFKTGQQKHSLSCGKICDISYSGASNRESSTEWNKPRNKIKKGIKKSIYFYYQQMDFNYK